MAGKGSAPRPLSVSDEEFGKRFDAIDWSDRSPERGGHPMPAPGTPGYDRIVGILKPRFGDGDFGLIEKDEP